MLPGIQGTRHHSDSKLLRAISAAWCHLQPPGIAMDDPAISFIRRGDSQGGNRGLAIRVCNKRYRLPGQACGGIYLPSETRAGKRN